MDIGLTFTGFLAFYCAIDSGKTHNDVVAMEIYLPHKAGIELTVYRNFGMLSPASVKTWAVKLRLLVLKITLPTLVRILEPRKYQSHFPLNFIFVPTNLKFLKLLTS